MYVNSGRVVSIAFSMESENVATFLTASKPRVNLESTVFGSKKPNVFSCAKALEKSVYRFLWDANTIIRLIGKKFLEGFSQLKTQKNPRNQQSSFISVFPAI